MSKDYRSVWFSEFIIPIYSVRELLWFLLKSANFLEIWDTDYWRDKRFRFFSIDIYFGIRGRIISAGFWD